MAGGARRAARYNRPRGRKRAGRRAAGGRAHSAAPPARASLWCQPPPQTARGRPRRRLAPRRCASPACTANSGASLRASPAACLPRDGFQYDMGFHTRCPSRRARRRTAARSPAPRCQSRLALRSAQTLTPPPVVNVAAVPSADEGEGEGEGEDDATALSLATVLNGLFGRETVPVRVRAVDTFGVREPAADSVTGQCAPRRRGAHRGPAIIARGELCQPVRLAARRAKCMTDDNVSSPSRRWAFPSGVNDREAAGDISRLAAEGELWECLLVCRARTAECVLCVYSRAGVRPRAPWNTS
jgi:hypothetical protein